MPFSHSPENKEDTKHSFLHIQSFWNSLFDFLAQCLCDYRLLHYQIKEGGSHSQQIYLAHSTDGNCVLAPRSRKSIDGGKTRENESQTMVEWERLDTFPRPAFDSRIYRRRNTNITRGTSRHRQEEPEVIVGNLHQHGRGGGGRCGRTAPQAAGKLEYQR